MKTRFILLAAMVAFVTAAVTAQGRSASVRRNGTTIEVRIIEPAGVDHYLVFQGAGIGGPVEIPATLVPNCPGMLFITIGNAALHNHQHTVVWVDCTGVQHRWVLAVPLNLQWLAGGALAAAAPIGWGCGTNAPLALDLDAPPTLGTSPNFVLTDVPSGTLFSAVFFSGSLASTPSPLASYGLPVWECYVFIDLGSALQAGSMVAPGASASFPISLPPYPGLTGALSFAQAVALSPGQNPAGVITSNGLGMVFAQ